MQKSEVVFENKRTKIHAAGIRIHGGNISEAARQYGLSEDRIIDFSSNINPLGPPSSAMRAARRAVARIGRYPEPLEPALCKSISQYFGIKPEQVLCGHGSSAIIHLIAHVFKPKKVLIPLPTYSEYAAAVAAAGGDVTPLVLDERTGFRIDPLDLALSLKGADMVFLCNPNNPTGLLTPKADMLEIVKYAREHSVRLVVDEAFMDFVSRETLVKDAVQTSHVICIRTFAKFFGMPGLRIGYAVSDESTIAALREGQEPWPVNIPAAHAAIAALNDWRHAKKTLKLIEKERERMRSEFRILPGVETFPGSANFLLIKVDAARAPLFAEKLAARGYLVRDCSSFPGLDHRFIRVAVRAAGENKRLLQAMRELLTADQKHFAKNDPL